MLYLLIILLAIDDLSSVASRLVNVALNKPSYLSSAYKEDGIDHSANVGVDGVKGGGEYTMTQLNSELSPHSQWFVVDLLNRYSVQRVVVYGRMNEAHSMPEFLVGLSNDFDPIRNRSIENVNIHLCGHHDKSDQLVVVAHCLNRRWQWRYAVLKLKEESFQSLAFSEMEVYSEENYSELYIGCFSDLKVDEEITHLTRSVGTCIDVCSQTFHKYAAITKGNSCVCKSSLTTTSISSKFCNSKCPGRMGMCGGIRAFSVYSVKLDGGVSAIYQGCFRIPLVKPHTVFQASVTFKSGVEYRMCLTYCLIRNFDFVAIRQNKICMCGNSNYHQIKAVPESQCNLSCLRDRDHQCGGSTVYSVYSGCFQNALGTACSTYSHCLSHVEPSYPLKRIYIGPKSNGHTDAIDFTQVYRRVCPRSLCQAGWEGHSCQLRDCSVQNGNCGQDQCAEVNIGNSRVGECMCSTGYARRNYLDLCKDIDECMVEADICAPNERCVNVIGSYKCEGEIVDGGSVVGRGRNEVEDNANSRSLHKTPYEEDNKLVKWDEANKFVNYLNKEKNSERDYGRTNMNDGGWKSARDVSNGGGNYGGRASGDNSFKSGGSRYGESERGGGLKSGGLEGNGLKGGFGSNRGNPQADNNLQDAGRNINIKRNLNKDPKDINVRNRKHFHAKNTRNLDNEYNINKRNNIKVNMVDHKVMYDSYDRHPKEFKLRPFSNRETNDDKITLKINFDKTILNNAIPFQHNKKVGDGVVNGRIKGDYEAGDVVPHSNHINHVNSYLLNELDMGAYYAMNNRDYKELLFYDPGEEYENDPSGDRWNDWVKDGQEGKEMKGGGSGAVNWNYNTNNNSTNNGHLESHRSKYKELRGSGDTLGPFRGRRPWGRKTFDGNNGVNNRKGHFIDDGNDLIKDVENEEKLVGNNEVGSRGSQTLVAMPHESHRLYSIFVGLGVTLVLTVLLIMAAVVLYKKCILNRHEDSEMGSWNSNKEDARVEIESVQSHHEIFRMKPFPHQSHDKYTKAESIHTTIAEDSARDKETDTQNLRVVRSKEEEKRKTKGSDEEERGGMKGSGGEERGGVKGSGGEERGGVKGSGGEERGKTKGSGETQSRVLVFLPDIFEKSLKQTRIESIDCSKLRLCGKKQALRNQDSMPDVWKKLYFVGEDKGTKAPL